MLSPDPDTNMIEHFPPSTVASQCRSAKQRLGLTSSAALMAKELPPVRFVVPGIIAEGLTLLAGKSKIGKSWLILGTAIAVALGGRCFGSIQAEQGDVLYLALEDNERRLQSRLRQLLPSREAPDRLFIDTTCPRLDHGLVDDLRSWIVAMPNARLIIIDVLNRVRPALKKNEGVYDYDVRSLEELQGLAAEFGLAIIVVHHTRKADAEDPFDCLSGSTGLPGTADSTFVLTRDSQGVTLYGRGRDIEEVEHALSFDRRTGSWTILGKAEDVRRSNERSQILAILKDAPEAMKPADLAALMGVKSGAVRGLLLKMARDGEVSKARYGRYLHPSRVEHTPADRTPNDSNGGDAGSALGGSNSVNTDNAPADISPFGGGTARPDPGSVTGVTSVTAPHAGLSPLPAGSPSGHLVAIECSDVSQTAA